MKMQLKKQNVTSKVSLSSILMNAYPRFNGSSDHEFYLAKLKYIECFIQYKCSGFLIGRLSRHYLS